MIVSQSEDPTPDPTVGSSPQDPNKQSILPMPKAGAWSELPGGAMPNPGGIAPSVGGTAAPGNVGNDPTSMIDSLYKQYGVADGGRGSGFADRAYWLEHPSEIQNGRLGADLAGTGTDQPTGTPGTGPWQNSGKGQPEAGGGAPPPGMGMGAGSMAGMGAIQGYANQGQATGGQPGDNLIMQLLARLHGQTGVYKG